MPVASFAVVIPAWNEEAHIGRTVAAVLAGAGADGPAVDVVVADNGSTDRTRERARAAGARVLPNESGRRVTIAALRNRGAEHARGDVLAFLDADMLVPPNWLERAAARFSPESGSGFPGALGFVEDVPRDAPWAARAWGRRGLSQTGDKAVDFLPGRNILVARAAFRAVGGFDESLTTNEDKDFTYRLRRGGFPVLRLAETRVVHLGHERGLGEFVRKEFWRQSSTLRFARRHGFAPRTLRNPLLSLWHLLCPLAALAAFPAGAPAAAAAFLAAWPLPSALLALRHGLSGASLAVWALTFLRWNVSGAALLGQVLRGEPFGAAGRSGSGG